MTFFAPDLFRSFGIGFALGLVLLAGATAEHWAGNLESPAQAAAPLEAPQPNAEFLIEPLELDE